MRDFGETLREHKLRTSFSLRLFHCTRQCFTAFYDSQIQIQKLKYSSTLVIQKIKLAPSEVPVIQNRSHRFILIMFIRVPLQTQILSNAVFFKCFAKPNSPTLGIFPRIPKIISFPRIPKNHLNNSSK